MRVVLALTLACVSRDAGLGAGIALSATLSYAGLWAVAPVASVAKVSKAVRMSKSLAASKDFEQPIPGIELGVRCS